MPRLLRTLLSLSLTAGALAPASAFAAKGDVRRAAQAAASGQDAYVGNHNGVRLGEHQIVVQGFGKKSTLHLYDEQNGKLKYTTKMPVSLRNRYVNNGDLVIMQLGQSRGANGRFDKTTPQHVIVSRYGGEQEIRLERSGKVTFSAYGDGRMGPVRHVVKQVDPAQAAALLDAQHGALSTGQQVKVTESIHALAADAPLAR
jgi:hypothetical protein